MEIQRFMALGNLAGPTGYEGQWEKNRTWHAETVWEYKVLFMQKELGG